MHSTQILTARPLERRAGFPVTVQATNLTGPLVRLIRSWWRAFARHGEERRMIARLRAMSDSQLRDLGIARADIHAMRGAYKMIFDPSRAVAENMADVEHQFGDVPVVRDVLDFIKARGKRQLTVPPLRDSADSDDDDG